MYTVPARDDRGRQIGSCSGAVENGEFVKRHFTNWKVSLAISQCRHRIAPRSRQRFSDQRSTTEPEGVACLDRSQTVSLRGRRASGHLLRPRSLAAQATEAPSPPDLHLVVSGEQCAHPGIRAHHGA